MNHENLSCAVDKVSESLYYDTMPGVGCEDSQI